MISVKTNNNQADWRFIREEVFMIEQGFQNEFDSIDEIAIHITLYVDGKLAGCARCFPSEEEATFVFGRIAVLKEYRKLGLGARLLQELETVARAKGASCAILDAQCRAAIFYEKQGYQQSGELHMDEHVPHIQMRKDLQRQ